MLALPTILIVMDDDRDDGSIDAIKPSKMHQATTVVLEAAKIFLLMPKNVPISRSARFQWLLDNLNNVVTVSDNVDTSGNSSDTLEVISVVAVGDPSAHLHAQYRVTTATELVFLSRTYRVVYCLDMSPSQSAVDIGQGEILFDEIINCFRTSLLGLCRQFTIGGNDCVFQPCLYLTVIVNTPFFISPAQQVLIKGVRVSSHNVQDIVTIVQGQFHHLEGRIAEVSAMAYEQMHQQQMRYAAAQSGAAAGTGNVFSNANSNDNECNSNIPMVSPDANFVNMLRYSMLAISLLPGNSLSNILVITDGVAAMPDSNIMESILYQLHYDSISLSFLKVGSCFHWNSSAGYVSYTDLLLFLSHSTLGTYLDRFPVVKPEPTLSMNLYQELYLLWTYNCKDKIISPHLLQDIQICKSDEFQPSRLPTLLSKRQTEENVNASMLLLISRRMREGYTVNEVCISNGMIDIKLSLHWKSFIYIHYFITTQWPIATNISHLQVFISAPYDFLHDITCCLTRRETIKSAYRQAVFERFWVRMTQLTTADNQLSRQLSAMLQSAQWYALPESVRNGVPVLVLGSSNANSASSSGCSDDVTYKQLLLSATDAPACRGFADVWMAICQVHTNNWRKWLHTHKLSLILRHDHPLPKHMHLANASGRFQVIQCRQAAMSLYRLLNVWSSFVLIDNHTYLKLLYADEQHHHQPVRHHHHQYEYHHQPIAPQPPPVWFCIVRVSSKLPCATLHLGFVSGTPGHVRYSVVGALRRELDRLCHVASGEEIRCCTMMRKPLEKILIKYERMPNDFHTVIFPDGTEPPYSMQSLPASPLAGTLFTTLSRYLFHQRWIWNATHPTNPRLGVLAISRILNTITRMRLREGFKFAHSAAGIVTMVLELDMVPSGTCVVQYVLFPPHSACWGEESSAASAAASSCADSTSAQRPKNAVGTGDVGASDKIRADDVAGDEDIQDDESDDEEGGDSELQMVTEVWIEPQYGCVKANESRNGYMNKKYYYELSDLIRFTDLRCINALLTLEHLSLMCQKKGRDAAHNDTTGISDGHGMPDIEIQIPSTRRPSRKRYTSMSHDLGLHDFDRSYSHTDNSTPWNPFLVQRIQHIAFKFDVIGVLPLCRLTELLFSMFTELPAQATEHFYNHTKLITPNHLLLENIHHHLRQLNDAELTLTASECFHLTEQLRERCDRNSESSPNRSVLNRTWFQNDNTDCNNAWRCFVRGVSVTHVILTFVPGNVSRLLMQKTEEEASTITDSIPTLPVYVIDCPLAMLVDSFIQPANQPSPHEGSPSLDAIRTLIGSNPGDVYEDRRYNIAACNGVGTNGHTFKLDGTRVRSARNSNSDSTTVKSEATCATSEDIGTPLGTANRDQQQEPRSRLREHIDRRYGTDNTVAQQQHSRALVLTHSKCFALTVFTTLHYEYHVHAIDVQSAMEQCLETLFEIDISEYMRTVCGHMKKHTDTIELQSLNQPTPCTDLSPLHRLIKDNFLRVVADSFSSVPTNKRFYYYSKIGLEGDDKPSAQAATVSEDHNDDERRSNATSNSTNTLASEEMLAAASASASPAPASVSAAHIASTIAATAATAGIVASDSSENMLEAALDRPPNEVDVINISTEVLGLTHVPLVGTNDESCTTLHRLLSALSGINCNEGFIVNISPLFLHFACSVRYDNVHYTKSVKVIPTCLGEVAQTLSGLMSHIDKSKLRVSLDIVCLTLPIDVQNVINDYSAKGIRSTSFCSDGFVPSTRSSASETSFTSDFKEPEVQFQIPDIQRYAINVLQSEIEWLLRNETITAMLDLCYEPIAQETLVTVMQHVDYTVNSTLQPVRSGCCLELVHLRFVCARAESHARFVAEFPQITATMPDYKLCKQTDIYYLAKNLLTATETSAMIIQDSDNNGTLKCDVGVPQNKLYGASAHGGNNTHAAQRDIAHSQEDAQSDVSSLGEVSVLSTSTGYDEDVSEDDEGFDWLIELSNKRLHLPNFWLIMRVTADAVWIYFHCRFMDLPTGHVATYRSIQRDIVTAIRDLCKSVNQTMLLRQLYDTRICSNLLESEESFNEFGNHNVSYTRLRSAQESIHVLRRSPKTKQQSGRSKFKLDKEMLSDNKKADTRNSAAAVAAKRSAIAARREINFDDEFSSNEEMNYEPGHFKCPVIWEHPFSLHPRLKTGVGKSSLNVGFNAMTSVLEKFNVIDRRNMFVIQSKSGCVFYLYLYEHIQSQSRQLNVNPLDPPVSRSPSVASLPTGHQRERIDSSGTAPTSYTPAQEVRPRVRSVGDRESWQHTINEDCIVLKVRGLPPICDEISCELVGVLQNRLDDTVLEFLSITLARNWRCPLTPEDVTFLQKPYRSPDKYITMSLNPHVVHLVDAFYYYLKENLLQWMNVPNYTDSKYGQFHFKDTAIANPHTSKYHDESIFLFNQNQNPSSGQPSSGHHAIAVVSFCVIDKRINAEDMPRIHIDSDDYIGLGPEPVPSLNELTALLTQGPMYAFAIAQLIANMEIYTTDFNECASRMYVQFRVWKNGRLNWDLLSDILLKAVNQTQWDLITEFYLLRMPFCCDDGQMDDIVHVNSDKLTNYEAKRKNDITHSVPSALKMDLQMQMLSTVGKDDDLSGNETDDTLVPEEDMKNKDEDKSVFVAIRSPETGAVNSSRLPHLLRQNGNAYKTNQGRPRQFYAKPQYIGRGKSCSKPVHQCAKPPLEVGLKTPILRPIPVSASENGLSGMLKFQYWRALGEWLTTGEQLGSPNVRKFMVQLKPQDSLGMIAREVSNQMSIISQDPVRSFHFAAKLVGSSIVHYYAPFDYALPADQSPLNAGYPIDKDMPVILLARNNQYWKLQMDTLGSCHYPDGINSNYLLHSQYQRTLPALVQNRTFVPRQKMAMAIITRKQIVFLTYNWNKDNAERLSDLQQAQSLWLNARSVSLSSGIQAKLGHFHNLSHQRQTVHTVQNPYMQYMQELDVVATFQPDRIRKSQLLNAVAASAAFTNSTYGNIITAIPSPIMQERERSSSLAHQRHSSMTSSNSTLNPATVPVAAVSSHNISLEIARVFRDQCVNFHPPDAADTDTTLAMCYEMQALNASDISLEEIRTLRSLYISGDKIRSLDYIDLIHKFGRIIHYCHTPMLFLSKWRIATAATRDQSLIPREISDLNFDDFEEWHNELCVAFVTECTRYIKKLGFQECSLKPDRLLISEWRETGTIKVYLHKNIMGGLMIYIIAMVEPFVTTKLMVVECDRFIDKPVKTKEFSLTFLDECDRIRDTMHLHSFTYDFHLRAVSNYLSGVAGIKLYSGFHLTRFLDDFIRYYTKSPNYARNLVYAGEMDVSDLVIDGRHLYNYLLSHNRDYGFETVTMRERHDLDADYVLVQTTRVPHIVYTDSADRQHTDNFDLTLIASYVQPPQQMHAHTEMAIGDDEERSEQAYIYHQRENRLSCPGRCYHTGWDRSEGRFIKLRYYIVLTTRGDIYPKANAERKLGKFRTVSINARQNANDFGDMELDIETQASTSAENTLSSTLMPSDEDLTVTETCTPVDGVEHFTASPFMNQHGSFVRSSVHLHPLKLLHAAMEETTSPDTDPVTSGTSPSVRQNADITLTKTYTCDAALRTLLREPNLELVSSSGFTNLRNQKSPSATIEDELNELARAAKADEEDLNEIWKATKTSSTSSNKSNNSDDQMMQFELDITPPTKPDDETEETLLTELKCPHSLYPPHLSYLKNPSINNGTDGDTDKIPPTLSKNPKILSASLTPGAPSNSGSGLTACDIQVPKMAPGASLSVPTVFGFHIKENAPESIAAMRQYNYKSSGDQFDASLKLDCSPRSPAASTPGAVAGASVSAQKPEIRQEKVNYLGYFSTHEQLMQNVMHECARSSEQKLRDMVQKGTVDCRTHYLWDKLMTVCCELSFAEFAELKSQSLLVQISQATESGGGAPAQHGHHHVTTVLAQSATWHERFAKSISTKYLADHSRHYASDDGAVQYWIALHPRYDRACILMVVDFHANHGDVYVMERILSNPESEMDKQDKQEFLQDFMQKFSYQIWIEMVNN